MLLRRSPLWVSSLVLLLPAILWYGVFFLAPLVQMIGISFAVPGPYGGVEPGFVLDSYQELANPLYLNIFLVTLRMAFIGTLACLIVGYPLAYFLARTYTWKTILDPQGAFSQLLQAIGVIHQPLQVLYSPVAIFIGILYNYLPLMVFPLYVALERLDKRLLEASKDLGAGRFATFWRVTLPLTLPGVITGCLLVFIPLTGEYLIPTILGGSKNIFMGNLIANQFLEARNWPFGATLGVAVIVLLLLLVSIYLAVFRRVQSVPVS
ncbi:MAG: ABC transporter permease [Chloroflexi bacterium]|nr:MAG: ABC transporter permease [Chloroflexota bacterium]